MVVDIHSLIATINPDVYCDPTSKDKVKEKLKEYLDKKDKAAYLKTAKDINPKAKGYEVIDFYKQFYRTMTDYNGLFKKPIEKHKIVYDNFGESLEGHYFWMLDTLSSLGLGETTKVIDNFISSPGSGHFSEMGMKVTRMQEEASKLMGTVNTVIKSILNIIYDMKEFKMRLQTYDDSKSSRKELREAATLGLKQIWMDAVDAKRGTTSLKGFAQQFDYVTLIHAFMAANSLEDIKENLDLNEPVKRILLQRYRDYQEWVKQSEQELRKRFEIEKIYLRSQYNMVQVYARWAKPYLRAAHQLEQNASPSASLVNVFNTSLFELSVLGRGNYDPNDDVAKGNLPRIFIGTNNRKYSPIVIIEFRFRSVPEKFGQNYGFRGRVEVTFTSYGLNQDEIDVLKQQLEMDDFGDVLNLIENATGESLAHIQEDVNEFIYGKSKEDQKKEEEERQREENPDLFDSLFSFWKSGKKAEAKEDKKEKKDDGPKKIEQDSEKEKVLRGECIFTARQRCVKIYELYKKSRQMPVFSSLGDVF